MELDALFLSRLQFAFLIVNQGLRVGLALALLGATALVLATAPSGTQLWEVVVNPGPDELVRRTVSDSAPRTLDGLNPAASRECCMAARIAGILLAGLMTGCAGVLSTPPDPPVREATALAPPVPPTTTPDKSEPKPAPPPAKAPAASKAPAAPAAVPREPQVATRKPQAAPPVAAKPEGSPTLDLESLEQRLKETSSIGLMTKLSLKNQVDDLLEQFRDHYQGRLKTTLAELRQLYELLLMKTLSLLQDGDPALAKAIHGSREAIWAILSDRDKFSKLP